jgi:hypothetical protein
MAFPDPTSGFEAIDRANVLRAFSMASSPVSTVATTVWPRASRLAAMSVCQPRNFISTRKVVPRLRSSEHGHS